MERPLAARAQHLLDDVAHTAPTARILGDVARRFQTHLSGKGAKFTRAYPPEEIAAVWRCGDKGTAARVEYAIKKRLTHQQKEQLAAAPDTLAELLPEVGECRRRNE